MGVSLSSLFLSNPKTITSSLRTVGAISFLTGASLIPLLLLLGEITGERTPIRINSVPEVTPLWEWRRISQTDTFYLVFTLWIYRKNAVFGSSLALVLVSWAFFVLITAYWVLSSISCFVLDFLVLGSLLHLCYM